ncbi:hypothetical protein E4T48_00357 [Aureobasidium sp. EXF-10727]|nr:hypothetical protein E4T48_00357 [Aureobasidium sp. EXF-10727]KAI4729755.1 hypothetical protein E4T49_02410 [Aureobasidium sp. EXF-10728]
MAPSSPPRSRSASISSFDWIHSDKTAHGMLAWTDDTFKTHISKSILQEFWNDRDNADFEIHCAAERFKVHKAILRSHSEVLAKICDSRSFKRQEALSGVLALKAHPYHGKIDNLGDGDDPEIVQEMIYYFYHLELSPKARVISPWMCEVVHVEPSLVFLARIYVLAEKYFIEGLKTKVMEGFSGSLCRDFQHPELIEACHIIYEKTVEPAGEKGLKTIVAKSLAEKLEKVKESEMHDKLFQEIPELAFRVLKEVKKPRPQSLHCPCCGAWS